MKFKCLGLAAATVLAFSAQAGDVSYDFGEVGYISVDADEGDESLNGFYLSGTKSFTENWHAFAGFDSTSIDGTDFETDFSKFQLGVGYNYPVSETVDFVGQIGFASNELEVCEDNITPGGGTFRDCDKDDDTGFVVNLGVRSLISENIELNARLRYEDVWEFAGNTTNFEFGGVYLFSDNYSVNFSYEVGELVEGLDANTVRLGFRYNF